MSDREALLKQLAEQAAALRIEITHLHSHLLAQELIEELLVWFDAKLERHSMDWQLPMGIAELRVIHLRHSDQGISEGKEIFGQDIQHSLVICRWAETEGCAIPPNQSCPYHEICLRGRASYQGVPWYLLVPTIKALRGEDARARHQRGMLGGTDLIRWQDGNHLRYNVEADRMEIWGRDGRYSPLVSEEWSQLSSSDSANLPVQQLEHVSQSGPSISQVTVSQSEIDRAHARDRFERRISGSEPWPQEAVEEYHRRRAEGMPAILPPDLQSPEQGYAGARSRVFEGPDGIFDDPESSFRWYRPHIEQEHPLTEPEDEEEQ
jgi:hypothetical protein